MQVIIKEEDFGVFC